jgi:hypothetical protein
VRVDEAGQKRLAGEVDHLRRAALVPLLHLGARPDGHDLPVLDRQRLGARLGIIHGHDVTTDVDRVGGVDRRFRSACGDGNERDAECARSAVGGGHGDLDLEW